jgi:cytochrome bd-type quinol oxidase subunit 2
MKKKLGFWIVEEQLPFVLPLFGLAILWFASGWAQLAELLQRPNYYVVGTYSQNDQYLHASIYIFLVALVLLGAATVIGKRIARGLPESRIAKSARGFTTLSAIFTLILGVIFGFATFMTGYQANQGTELLRIFSVYVPILLDAALLVSVIIFSFVAKGEGEDDE